MKELLTLSKASKILGVTTKTLRNWDDAGKIKTIRTEGNHRRIPVEEIDRIKGDEPKSSIRVKTLVYCRCSTKKQEENLERQIGRVLEYCYKQKWEVELFKDIGSGLNENRRNFKKLLKRVADDDVQRVVIEYKDRVARYGFETFKALCYNFGVEMVDDIISLVTSYSARIYGKRGGRRKIG
jgi:putative resolvase